MTITFLCGSLEPGHDGVGDYTRRLAGELIRQGHQASIIALNDRLIDNRTETTQEVDGIYVQVIRLSASMCSKERFNQVEKYITDFDPEWLSLQYVPFSFQDKGLPFGLGKRLAKIGKGRKWHVMFHELWVGIKVGESVKRKCWGEVQRQLIATMIHQLKPMSIHTQTPLYLELLGKYKIKSDLLPLYSNINLNNCCQNKVKEDLVFILFGSLHPLSNLREFLLNISDFQKINNSIIKLKVIGRTGKEIDKWKQITKELKLDFTVLGEQTQEIIAWELNQSTIGVSTTALPLIQKSGTVAAMRECGLPVICLDSNWKPRGIPLSNLPDGIFLFEQDVIDICLKYKGSGNDFPGLIRVANMFIENLSNIEVQ